MAVTSEILEGVKERLSESGEFAEIDATISGYIEDVMDYMSGAGVSDEMIASHIGCIARGVDDLYCNNSGVTDFSPAFKNQVAQLAYRSY
jgi:hypothetical protein